MAHGKDNLFSLVIPLIEKLTVAYIEYLTKRSIINKFWDTFKKSIASFGVLLLISLIYAGSSWLALMCLLIIYLQTLNLSLIVALLIVLATNICLLLITLLGLFKLKKKILNINL